MAPRPRFEVLKETFVKPAKKEHEEEKTALNGFDVTIGHMVRLVYYFEGYLPVEALKSSLSEALVSFPLLAGRSCQEGKRHYVDLNGAGALVREQRATFYGHDEGLDSPSLRPYLDGFAGPERFCKKHGGHLMTLTLTEVAHAESFFACSPPAACKGAQEASQAEDWSGKRPIKYALGVSASHGVADGASVAGFLLTWAMVSCGGPRIPLAPYQRSTVLSQVTASQAAAAQGGEGEHKAQERDGGGGAAAGQAVVAAGGAMMMPKDFVKVGFLGRMTVMASAMLSEFSVTNCSLYFSAAELDAIKARCMAPLAGTNLWVTTSNSLAALCWPIISAIIKGEDYNDEEEGGSVDRPLCPFLVVFNARKHLGLPPTFFGNCASFEAVETSTAKEDITRLALKVRKSSSMGDGDRIRSEYSYMQQLYEEGNVQAVMHRVMRDGLLGKPFMGWDDVSGFQPPPSPSQPGGGGVAFGGQKPMMIDFHPGMWFPGMAFVLPAPHGNDQGGKEVVVCLKRSQARQLMTDKWQRRLHRFKPAATTPQQQQPAAASLSSQGSGVAGDAGAAARPPPPSSAAPAADPEPAAAREEKEQQLPKAAQAPLPPPARPTEEGVVKKEQQQQQPVPASSSPVQVSSTTTQPPVVNSHTKEEGQQQQQAVAEVPSGGERVKQPTGQ